MAQDKFMFFPNFKAMADKLDSESRLAFYDALTDYVFFDKEPSDPIISALVEAIKPSLNKIDGRRNNGGNHNPNGVNQHSKSGQSGQIRSKLVNSGQFLSETETETEEETETKEKEISVDISKKKFTTQSKFYVDGQYFDEFPVESLPLLKKHWSDDELESIRKELACKPEHETSVEQLLAQYPPLQKQAEEHFERFWSSYTPVKTTDGRVVSKGSRKEAETKYLKIVKSGVKPDDILNGLRAYINDCQQNNRLTCGATVFLNQERWKDDYKPITAIAQQSIPQMPRMSLKEMKEMQNELEIQKILRGER